MTDYTPIIGMEIHVELKTKSKMFCGCKNDPYHAPKPNIYTCPVCLGLPGALPVANKKAVEWTIMLGLALGCEIPLMSKFDRKNYFYPDLAKGYQISQYDKPLAVNGWLEIDAQDIILGRSEAMTLGSVIGSDSGQARMTRSNLAKKRIGITRVHLEEDTGKLQHATVDGKKVSLIDFNRSGVPLVEIVTEPDIRSSEEAKEFLLKLHKIITKLGISDAEMEKGSMRLEPNVSLKKVLSVKRKTLREELPNYKVEVKNINSFNFVKKAIDYEIERQAEILEKGETPVQETRGWDEKKGITLPQRRKEEAHDYRYFPDPDLPPMKWTKDYIEELRNKLPEMPDQVVQRFINTYHFPSMYAEMASGESEFVEFIDSVIELAQKIAPELSPKTIGDWIFNKKVDFKKTTSEELVKTIKSAKTVVQIDEVELDKIISNVLTSNQKAVTDYKSGKVGVIMFLVGMVLKELKGKGNAQQVRVSLEQALQK